jgi:CheY-like chemotaxis protein
LNSPSPAFSKVPPQKMPMHTAVLVVANQEAMRVLMVRALFEEGYQVLEARDGAEALEVLASAPDVKLIVTDIMMPRMDGFELAARVANWSDIPVLLISGVGPCYEEVSATLLQMPFSPSSLCSEVRRLLASTQSPAD